MEWKYPNENRIRLTCDLKIIRFEDMNYVFSNTDVQHRLLAQAFATTDKFEHSTSQNETRSNFAKHDVG